MTDIRKFDTKKWFIETPFPGARRCKTDIFRIEKEIYCGKTAFQKVLIFKTRGFGIVLALDGIVQLSQSDEFIYHEMIVHVPLLSHPAPKRFLVVGGGDGGVLREACKYPLKELYQVEIDQEIVELARKKLPFISNGAFSDKRLSIRFEDGFKVMGRYRRFFDVVVVDSTDPVGPGRVLFERPFYEKVYHALTREGVAIFQLGPFLDFDPVIKRAARTLQAFFPYVHPVRLPMPSYSCGSEYCFMLASKKINPATLTPAVLTKRLASRLGTHVSSLRYYTPAMHAASLIMPKLWQLGG